MTIANYKSVKNPQTISFVALNDKRMDVTKTIPGTDKFNVLKSTAIIGPNGAGKSTFVRALEAIKGIVFAPEDAQNVLKRYFSKAAFAYGDGKTRPCEISMDVLLNKGNPEDENDPSVVARYSIKATQDRFYEETLYYIINGSKKLMFERLYNPETQEYDYRFGKLYRGEKKRQAAKLPEDRSFLQGAAEKGGLTAGELYTWLDKSLDVLPLGYGASAERVVIDGLKAHPEWSDQIVNFLFALDVTDVYRLQVLKNDKGQETIGISHCFVNKNATEAYGQTFMNESLSLRRLILIAVSFFNAFVESKTIVIDDFGQLLHPYVLCHIVELFHQNDTDSQLVVVDCNPALLQKDLLRKDSIWFAEKGEESSTEFVSLSDFRGVKSKVSIYDAYLQGVFGAVPIESDFCFQNNAKENN
ncbi:MAG: AAA family ATPase [Spirochaetales bacterium]|nr:AAA family ATPase [Candidatus Physcosoma equi]